MVRLPSCLRACLPASLLLTIGCQAPPPEAPEPHLLSDEQYRPAYEAARQTLREQGYKLDEQSYRFGRVSTRPHDASTLAEPWRGDNQTLIQALEHTLSHTRRRIVVELTPVAFVRDRAGDYALQPLDSPAEHYRLDVRVHLERREEPTRRLTGATGRGGFSRLGSVPLEWRDQDITDSYWSPLGRDRPLEQHLHAHIARQLQARDQPQ